MTLGPLITPERSISALSTTLCPVTYLSHFHVPGHMGSHKSRLASSGRHLRFKYTRNWMGGHTDVKEAQRLRFTQNRRSPISKKNIASMWKSAVGQEHDGDFSCFTVDVENDTAVAEESL